MEFRCLIDRPFERVVDVFAGPVSAWLPVIAGPREHSWRAETEEGPIGLRVLVDAGAVFVRPDGQRWRAFEVEPDPTARGGVAAFLTPAIRGHLGLRETTEGGAELIYRGETEGRTKLTSWLERVVVGERLSHSAIETLVEHVAGALATANGGDDPSGATAGRVTCALQARQA